MLLLYQYTCHCVFHHNYNNNNIMPILGVLKLFSIILPCAIDSNAIFNSVHKTQKQQQAKIIRLIGITKRNLLQIAVHTQSLHFQCRSLDWGPHSVHNAWQYYT